jgi:prepilin-type N-terminal cleavage/methylation domain-containing protein
MRAACRRLSFAPTRRGRAGAGDAGFTMMELVVAVGVIGTVLLGIAGVFIVSYTNVDHGGRVTRATTYAHQKVEELRNTAFSVLVANPTGSDVPESAFTRTWTVTPTGASPARIADVQVDVGFLSQTGRPATVQIRSQIAE